MTINLCDFICFLLKTMLKINNVRSLIFNLLCVYTDIVLIIVCYNKCCYICFEIKIHFTMSIKPLFDLIWTDLILISTYLSLLNQWPFYSLTLFPKDWLIIKNNNNNDTFYWRASFFFGWMNLHRDVVRDIKRCFVIGRFYSTGRDYCCRVWLDCSPVS